ncbi:MAG: rRNA pseudouridine synthase [Chloroflexi bacterium]|nr:rRNA pseudouridine synthase [Chloroflexota bacterium]
MSERLHKYLARSGVASRRACEQLIAAGRVQVNGVVVTVLGTQIDPVRDRVEVSGHLVCAPRQSTYVMLNKPAGVVSTAHDPEGRQTVLDLVPLPTRLYPVGRLDYDSEGLILLTDDGALAARLTHPRHVVEKEYTVLVGGAVTDDRLRRLRTGVDLDGKRTAPARFDVIDRLPDGAWLRVVLREGRNRQIRRMLAGVGLAAVRLRRVRVGSVTLGELPPGRWRRLTDTEVRALEGVTA